MPKVTYPSDRDIDVSYCRMLLHSAMVDNDSHRIATSDTPMCNCDEGKETTEQFLLYCHSYVKARCHTVAYNALTLLVRKSIWPVKI